MIFQRLETRYQGARAHAAHASPTSGPWTTGTESRTSQVRSLIRCIRIVRGKAEPARGSAYPSFKASANSTADEDRLYAPVLGPAPRNATLRRSGGNVALLEVLLGIVPVQQRHGT
jgi:hypothetical protein